MACVCAAKTGWNTPTNYSTTRKYKPNAPLHRDEVQVLCVCLSKYEIDTLQDVLRRVDPDAFYIVQEGVHAGGNFERHLG